nr:MAG TPA_asm: Spo0E like sporulation regulatory protein [Caudoviricetes sp.]
MPIVYSFRSYVLESIIKTFILKWGRIFMEELREKMYKAIEEYGIESEEALRLSQELDILVFQEQEKKIG